MYNHFWKEPRNEKHSWCMQFRGRSTDERNFDVRRHRGQSPSVIERHNLLGGCDTRLHLDFDPIGCDRKINPSKRSEICVCDVTELWETVFARFESESARRRHVHCSRSRSDVALVEIFTGPAPIDWWQEATLVKVRILFFLPSRVFQVYDCYFTNVLRQRSCFEVLLTADSQCFTRDDARIFVPMIPRRRRAFTVSWNIEVFVHCNSASSVVNFFSHQAPRHQCPLPANLHRYSRHPRFHQDETSSLLDRRRHKSIQTYSLYQLVSHLGTSTTLFPAIWTKTARSIEELFSQWTKPKRASSDQWTDEDTSETCNNNHVGGRTLTNA